MSRARSRMERLRRQRKLGKTKSSQPLLGDYQEYNNDTNFQTLLFDAKSLLTQLQKEVTSGAAILDPNTPKKQELVAKLKPIMDAISNQWQLAQAAEDEADKLAESNPRKKSLKEKAKRVKQKFKLAAKELKETILAATMLNVSTEATVVESAQKLNTETNDINISMTDLLAQFTLLNDRMKFIARIEYGKTLSTYLIYAAAAGKAIYTFVLAWADTLGEAAKAAGTLFYPINATFATIVKIFVLSAKAIQVYIAHDEANKPGNELAKTELENAKILLRKSAIFKFVAVTLNFLSILAFAGILTTPIGWMFVAAATTVDWLDDGWGASQRALEGRKTFLEKHALSDKESQAYQDGLNYCQEKIAQTQTAARWGFGSVVSIILIASAPIPIAGPMLSLAGLLVLGIVTVRNVYVAAKPYFPTIKDYFFPRKKEAKEELEETESDKFDRTLYVAPTPAIQETIAPKAIKEISPEHIVPITQEVREPKVAVSAQMNNDAKVVSPSQEGKVSAPSQVQVLKSLVSATPSNSAPVKQVMADDVSPKTAVKGGDLKVSSASASASALKTKSKEEAKLTSTVIESKKSSFLKLFSAERKSVETKNDTGMVTAKHSSPQRQVIRPESVPGKK